MTRQTQRLKLRIVEGVTAILDYCDEVIDANLKLVLEMMFNALKEHDAMVSLAACEFWSGLIRSWQGVIGMADDNDQEFLSKLATIKECLPMLMPELVKCCRISDAD